MLDFGPGLPRYTAFSQNPPVIANSELRAICTILHRKQRLMTSISRSWAATIFFSRVLLFELAQPLEVRRVHGTEALAARVDALLADAVFLGELGNRPLVGLAHAQDGDDLRLCESPLSQDFLSSRKHLLKF